MNGILSPVFLQAAGRAGKGGHVGKITLFTQFANPSISSISCTGEIKVSSIYNGEPLVETYSDLDGDALSIQADANTQIVISGTDITACEIGDNIDYTKISVKNTALMGLYCSYCYALTALDVSKNTALTELYCQECYALTALDVSKNTALTELYCQECYALTALDVSKNTALTTLYCEECYALTALDVSKNTALTNLNCENCTKLVSISYPATNEDVSTAIAGAITAATSTTGTVYSDNTAAYYNTIKIAAQTKGWTIAPIPA